MSSGAWVGVAARARGLSTHLLAGDRLGRVRRSGTVGELARALEDTVYARFVDPRAGTPAAIELAVSRSVAERMALLARWAVDERVLTPLFIEQDARNVRDIVRAVTGAGGGAIERGGLGTIPTPSLGRKELQTLARAEAVGAVAATLVQWGHPLGSALLEEASRRHPDLHRLEAAIRRCAAREATKTARRGGWAMRSFVRDGIDAQNIVAAVLLVRARAEGEPADFFVEGGTAPDVHVFTRAVAAPERAVAVERLAESVSAVRTPFAQALRTAPVSPAALEAHLLDARVTALERRLRSDPVSAVPVLLYALRLRREAQAVRRALWWAALAGEPVT